MFDFLKKKKPKLSEQEIAEALLQKAYNSRLDGILDIGFTDFSQITDMSPEYMSRDEVKTSWIPIVYVFEHRRVVGLDKEKLQEIAQQKKPGQPAKDEELPNRRETEEPEIEIEDFSHRAGIISADDDWKYSSPTGYKRIWDERPSKAQWNGFGNGHLESKKPRDWSEKSTIKMEKKDKNRPQENVKKERFDSVQCAEFLEIGERPEKYRLKIQFDDFRRIAGERSEFKNHKGVKDINEEEGYVLLDDKFINEGVESAKKPPLSQAITSKTLSKREQWKAERDQFKSNKNREDKGRT